MLVAYLKVVMSFGSISRVVSFVSPSLPGERHGTERKWQKEPNRNNPIPNQPNDTTTAGRVSSELNEATGEQPTAQGSGLHSFVPRDSFTP